MTQNIFKMVDSKEEVAKSEDNTAKDARTVQE
jgi:hypothetical protein